MSFATVQAWALSKGIDADMQSMTQAEKTMLRYQYVLENTGAATGDFIRTQNSWANQLRLLTGSFEQLGSVVGGTLTNVFKPLITALNGAMGAVINFAETVSNALGAIFGWEYQTGGGVAQDYEVAAGAAEDLADATGDAADNAKKLNKYIAPWHEVNNMTSSDNANGGGSGGGSLADDLLGSASVGEWIQTETMWEKYKSDIDSLYELGDYIGDVLTSALKDINWDKVYQSASNFGKGLANFLNGLISPDLFGSVGRTIAGALNTAIYSALSFNRRFDWEELGLSIATGINEFFFTFDFSSLAQAINSWANGILDMAITALENVKWADIGRRIGEFFGEINLTEIAGKIAQAFWKALSGAFSTYANMFSAAPLETALLTIVTVIPKLKQIKTIGTLLSNFGKKADKAATLVSAFASALTGNEAAMSAITFVSPKAASAIDGITSSFKNLQNGIKNGSVFSTISKNIQSLIGNLSALQKGALGAVGVFGEFSIIKDSFQNLIDGSGNVVIEIAKIGTAATAVGYALNAAFGPLGIAVAAVTGLIGIISGINAATEEAIADVIEYTDEIEQVSQERINFAQDAAEEVESAGVAEQAAVQELTDKYIALSKETESLERNEAMKNYAAQIAEIFPEAGQYIDDVTGLFVIQNDVLKDLTSATEDYYKLQAAQELKTDAYKNLVSAQIDLDEVNSQIEDYQNELDRLNQLQKEYMAQHNGYGDLGLSREIDETRAALNELTDAQTIVQQAYDESKESVDQLNASIEKSNEALEKSEEDAKASYRTSTKYQQALKDLRGEFSDLSTTVSDKLLDSLAFKDGDAEIENIIDTFGKLKEGVSLTTNEIESVMSDFGVTFYDGFSDSLSEATPEAQKNVILSMAEIQAGTKLSSEELGKVFSDLGYNLPQEVIAGFASQEDAMQIQTIQLLAKISAGEGLVAGNLETLFASLGFDTVSGTLLSALENSEPDVQAQTIQLISQIAVASDEQKQPLIDQLYAMGFDVGDLGLADGIWSAEGEVVGAVNGLSDAAIAALDKRKLSDRGVFGGYAGFITEGLVDGIRDKQGPVKQSMIDTANTMKSAFTSKEATDINSPSKVFKTYGGYIVEGLNDGIEDNQSTSRGVISTWVSNLTGWFTGFLGISSPSKIFKDFGGFTVEGYNEGLEDNMDSTFDMVSNWSRGIQDTFGNQIPTLDFKVDTSQYQPKPISVNTAEVSQKVQQAIDLAFTSGIIDYNRLGDAVYQAQTQAMQENPVQIGDDEIFQSTRRGQQRFQRRTNRTGWAGI